jgi:hypothetical protein
VVWVELGVVAVGAAVGATAPPPVPWLTVVWLTVPWLAAADCCDIVAWTAAAPLFVGPPVPVAALACWLAPGMLWPCRYGAGSWA